MDIQTFRARIVDNPDCLIRVELDNATSIAPHFHVTEVGKVTKQFVDCGGTPRTEERCILQTLVASDTEHRLDSTKLAGILSMVDGLDLSGDALVEVEHQERSVSTDQVSAVELVDGALVIRLTPKQTACLAEDACGIPQEPAPEACLLPIAGQDPCSGSGCC